tara:strand:- start:805 stop:1029 length:225 start_codon:yes stop_codon:yes gene_type:complete
MTQAQINKQEQDYAKRQEINLNIVRETLRQNRSKRKCKHCHEKITYAGEGVWIDWTQEGECWINPHGHEPEEIR